MPNGHGLVRFSMQDDLRLQKPTKQIYGGIWDQLDFAVVMIVVQVSMRQVWNDKLNSLYRPAPVVQWFVYNRRRLKLYSLFNTFTATQPHGRDGLDIPSVPRHPMGYMVLNCCEFCVIAVIYWIYYTNYIPLVCKNWLFCNKVQN